MPNPQREQDLKISSAEINFILFYFFIKNPNQKHTKLRMRLTRGYRRENTKQMYCRFIVRHILSFISALNESQCLFVFVCFVLFFFFNENVAFPFGAGMPFY